MKKVRVLQAIRQGMIGGGESHLIDLVGNFPDYVEPVVLSFTEGAMVDHFRKVGTEVHVIPTTRPFDFQVWDQVKEIIENSKIDFIHSHGTRATTNLIIPARQLKKKMVYTVHGWSFHQDQGYIVRNLRVLSERFIIKNVERVINVSEANYVSGEKYFNMDKAIVIENGVDTDKFNPENTFKDIRKELNIPKDAFVIGYFARITIQKDPLTFIKAVNILRNQIPNLKVLMVGDGDMKEESLKLIEERKLQDTIIFEDFRLDIPDLLKASDVFCLPSLWEGLSLSLLEAMSMGKGIVATPTDGTECVIKNNENGFIVPFQNPNELANGVKKLYDNPEKLKAFGNACRSKVLKGYSASLMSSKVAEVYQEVKL